jgi:hypothetical protein
MGEFATIIPSEEKNCFGASSGIREFRSVRKQRSTPVRIFFDLKALCGFAHGRRPFRPVGWRVKPRVGSTLEKTSLGNSNEGFLR